MKITVKQLRKIIKEEIDVSRARSFVRREVRNVLRESSGELSDLSTPEQMQEFFTNDKSARAWAEGLSSSGEGSRENSYVIPNWCDNQGLTDVLKALSAAIKNSDEDEFQSAYRAYTTLNKGQTKSCVEYIQEVSGKTIVGLETLNETAEDFWGNDFDQEIRAKDILNIKDAIEQILSDRETEVSL